LDRIIIWSITKINGVLLNSIDKINGIAKSSIVSKVNGIKTTQVTATLSATKYGLYTATSTTSWTVVINAASSVNNSTSSLSIGSGVFPSRTGTTYVNTRVNLQFDLSSFSTSSILSAKLIFDVNGITTTATPNEVFVLDLGGDTFDFPTLNNANYSLVYQSGSLTEYATNTIDNTGLYELQFNATALATASTYPAAYSMALLTYQDRQDDSTRFK
jgi:hypothetical protein